MDSKRHGKHKSTFQKKSVVQLRQQFREKLFNRMKDKREAEVDRMRMFMGDMSSLSSQKMTNFEQKSTQELHKLLLENKQLSEILGSDELENIIEDIKSETMLVESNHEVETYEHLLTEEINAVVQQFLTTCVICETVGFDVLCCNCLETHFLQEDFP